MSESTTDGGQPADSPTPATFEIPTIGELDTMRVARDLSQRDLSRRAGMEQSRLKQILTHDVDPHVSTMRAFLEVLREIEPDAARYDDRQGPKPDRSPAVDDESGSGEQADQSQTVRACPECDSTGVTATVRDTTDSDYYCRHCSARFDSPVERERYAESGLNGLARKLDDADPDAVSADRAGEPMTDGGQPQLDCCPECDSISIWRVTGGIRGDLATHDGDYRCRDCQASFNEPATRTKRNGGEQRRGLARRVAATDADDVGEPMTDGGQHLVYYASGQYDVYHERSDCRYLANVDTVCEIALSQAGSRDPCGVCADAEPEPEILTDGGQSLGTWRDYDTHLMQRGKTANECFHSSRDCLRIDDPEKSVDRSENYVAYHEPEPCEHCHSATAESGPEVVTDGGATPAAESEYYDAEDGFTTCPDCGGECQYQSPEVVVCLDCENEFSHFYDASGTNNLFRAPDMEHVCAVYDPADDQRGNETVMTDGGRVETADDEIPAFIDPQTKWVQCYFCNAVIEDLSRVQGVDVAPPDVYYPDMRPVCPDHDVGGDDDGA